MLKSIHEPHSLQNVLYKKENLSGTQHHQSGRVIRGSPEQLVSVHSRQSWCKEARANSQGEHQSCSAVKMDSEVGSRYPLSTSSSKIQESFCRMKTLAFFSMNSLLDQKNNITDLMKAFETFEYLNIYSIQSICWCFVSFRFVCCPFFGIFTRIYTMIVIQASATSVFS